MPAVADLLLGAGVGVVAGGSLEYVKAFLGRRDETRAQFVAHQVATLEDLQVKAADLFTIAQDMCGKRKASGSKLGFEDDSKLYAAHMAVEVLIQRVADDQVRRLYDNWSTKAYEHGANVATSDADTSADQLVRDFTEANKRLGEVLRSVRGR